MALAIRAHTSASALAEMVPTWEIDLLSVHGLASLRISSTAAVTALSIPRLISMGFIPAATDFRPSVTIAWARTVAVVVPSPGSSEWRGATTYTLWQHHVSNITDIVH